MDSYDASKMILTRIQTLEPQSASKIMGYILIQDLGDKELIRLAHGPETHLVSLINQAKSFLGFSSNMLSTPPNSTLFHQFPPPKITLPENENNGFFPHPNGHLKSPNFSSSPWSNGFPAFSRKSQNLESFGDLVNGGTSSSLLSLTMNNSSTNNLSSDEFPDHLEFNFEDPLIMSPSCRSDTVNWNYDDHSTPRDSPFLRRSCSVNDAYLFEDREGGGGGYNGNLLGGRRPCMYYARGFCENGSSCKFSHNFDADMCMVGSPNNMDGFDMVRMKAIQQRRFAAALELMASSPGHSFPYKRSGAGALMGEEFHKFGPCGPDMNNFPGLGLDCNSSSQQIYLTFPADSAFTEEDVSNYFSMYGPVQDVRIPYQQKRMFGFVTFVYAETVNLILAKGNPHFVCDFRVLVKPYKEKGKVAEKKRQHQLFDRESPACLSPTGFDAREPYDLPFVGRTFYNAKELMLKKHLEEQAELQQAIELQGRRLMDMHLMELKNNYNNHHSRPSFPPAFPLTSRIQTHPQIFQNFVQSSEVVDVEAQEANPTGLHTGDTPADVINENDTKEISEICDDNNGCESGSKDAKVMLKEADIRESLQLIFPDNLFASPTKSVTEHGSFPVRVPTETDSNSATIISSSNYKMTIGAVESAKSCHFQMPRFPSGQVVEM